MPMPTFTGTQGLEWLQLLSILIGYNFSSVLIHLLLCSDLRKFGRLAADHAMDILSKYSISGTSRTALMIDRITKMDYSLYR